MLNIDFIKSLNIYPIANIGVEAIITFLQSGILFTFNLSLYKKAQLKLLKIE